METLERAEIERVRAEFGDALVKVKTFRENLFLCVDKARLKEIAMFLRDDPAFEYKQFSDCTCCDYSKSRMGSGAGYPSTVTLAH